MNNTFVKRQADKNETRRSELTFPLPDWANQIGEADLKRDYLSTPRVVNTPSNVLLIGANIIGIGVHVKVVGRDGVDPPHTRSVCWINILLLRVANAHLVMFGPRCVAVGGV